MNDQSPIHVSPDSATPPPALDTNQTIDWIRNVLDDAVQHRYATVVPFPELVQSNLPLQAWLSALKGSDLTIPWSAEDLRLYGDPRSIAQAQTGYAADIDGRPLAGWPSSWFVIGQLGGDAIIANLGGAGFSVLFARHGMGRWCPEELAASPFAFAQSLNVWCQLFVLELRKNVYNDDMSLRPDFLERLGDRLKTILSERQASAFIRMVDG